MASSLALARRLLVGCPDLLRTAQVIAALLAVVAQVLGGAVVVVVARVLGLLVAVLAASSDTFLL